MKNSLQSLEPIPLSKNLRVTDTNCDPCLLATFHHLRPHAPHDLARIEALTRRLMPADNCRRGHAVQPRCSTRTTFEIRRRSASMMHQHMTLQCYGVLSFYKLTMTFFRFRTLHEVGALTDGDRLYLLFFLPLFPHGYLHSYPSGGPYLEVDREPGILL